MHVYGLHILDYESMVYIRTLRFYVRVSLKIFTVRIISARVVLLYQLT